MHVLHFFKTYWPDSFGGIERTIDAIATSTAKRDIQTTVLSLSRSPRENSVNFHGHTATKARLDIHAASTGFSLEAPAKFRKLAAEADIIHYHFPWPFMDLTHLVTQPRKPTLVTYHSDVIKQKYLKRLYAPLMNRFLGSVDHIVGTSQNYAATSPVLRKFSDKTTIIPIGIDEAPSWDVGLVDKWRSRFRGPFFLFTGVLRYYKGLEFLIDAALSVKADIVILGAGPLEAMLKRRANKLALTNVHFIGALKDDDKEALLQLCTGFVFPSHKRSEAYGIALVEAARGGRPMISTDIGTGTSFINLHRQTGLVIRPADSRALAEAMNEIVTDRASAHAWALAARQRYLTLFTAEQMGAAYAAIYSDLLKKKNEPYR